MKQFLGIARALVLVLLVSGCGIKMPEGRGRDSSRVEGIQTRGAGQASSYARQPSGPQIGRNDSLMNAIAPKLADWVAMWRAALPGFQVDSIWSGQHASWAGIRTAGFEDNSFRNEGGSDVTFELLGLPSPDGRYVLLIDSYQSIETDGETLEVGGEPESQPLLIDHRRNTFATLHECGTPCGFHWGTWLSPTRFALGGWLDADEFSHWKQGRLEIYSIPDSSVVTYMTRAVSTKAYWLYESAWEGWLLQRYRGLKAHAQGS